MDRIDALIPNRTTRAARGRKPAATWKHAVARLLVAWACLGLLSACETIGPQAVKVGMPAYNIAITQTGNELTLLNFVRMRYSETPYFMEVSNVFAAPRFTAGVGAGGTFGGAIGNTGSVSGALEYSETPTIVYTPVAGEQFSRRLLEPIGLNNVGLLFRGGWNIDRVFRLFVHRINNVLNAEVAAGPTPVRPPPDYGTFKRVVKTLHELEINGQIQIIAETKREADGAAKDGNRRVGSPIEFVLDPAVKKRPEVQQMLADLELDPKAPSYFITDARKFKPGRTMSIVTRPPLGTMFYLSKGVVVPDRDRGAVHITLDERGEPFDWRQVTGDLFVIESSDTRPENAFVAIEYRGTWFYIRDDDVVSKDTFVLFGILLALRAGEVPESETQLSIPIR